MGTEIKEWLSWRGGVKGGVGDIRHKKHLIGDSLGMASA